MFLFSFHNYRKISNIKQSLAFSSSLHNQRQMKIKHLLKKLSSKLQQKLFFFYCDHILRQYMKTNQKTFVSQMFEIGEKQADQTATNDKVLDLAPFTNSNLVDTSFQIHLEDDYAISIREASLLYLNNVVISKYDESKGFNDTSLFDIKENSESKQLSLTQCIKLNQFFTAQQKIFFENSLDINIQLRGLVSRLKDIFQFHIFKQICLIVFHVWQIYVSIKKQNMLDQEMKKLTPPTVLVFDQIDSENGENIQWLDKFKDLELEQLHLKSQKQIKRIFHGLLQNSKIHYVSLKQIHNSIEINQSQLQKQLNKFVNEISKAVISCVEGYFWQNNRDSPLNSFKQISFSDFGREQAGTKRIGSPKN